MRSLALASLIAALLAALPPSPVAAATGESGARLLVRFAPDAPASVRIAALSSVSAAVEGELPELGVTRIVVPFGDGDTAAAVRRVAQQPGVAHVEPDAQLRAEIVPNDPYWFSDPYTGLGEWGWRAAMVDRAWDLARGSPAILVAIIDTGVDLGHPELAGALVPGATFMSVLSRGCDRRDEDDNSHGTHVAGIIGAIGNNGAGIDGIASGVRIMPIKALDCTGSGAVSDIAEGIVWATDHGARIVNISLGTPADSATLRDAVNYALQRNVLIVAAVGNCGAAGGRCTSPDMTEYPAALPGVLAVGATDTSDGVAWFSTRGPHVAVAAPGVRILSTTPRYKTFQSEHGATSDYAAFSGTSQSAAFVSGVAALVWSAEPTLTATAVYDRLVATADDLGAPGRDDEYGAGRVNALRAVSHATLRAGFGASYDTRAVPHGMVAARTSDMRVTVTNGSGAVWRAAGGDAVRLGYHWLDRSGTTVVWDGERTELPQDVAPGEALAVTAHVKAPAEAGSYVLRFDLVREGVAWYSQRGVGSGDVSVSVAQGFAATYAPARDTGIIVGGSTRLLTVSLTNTGVRVWPASGPTAIRLAYHWLRPDGSVVLWDGARAPAFVSDVAPGQSAVVQLPVVAPSGKGAYVLRLDLVQEGIAWFSDLRLATSDIGYVVD